jgi:hypothetical protein
MSRTLFSLGIAFLVTAVIGYSARSMDTTCPGCAGSGASKSASGVGVCTGESVSITTTVESGDCLLVPDPPTAVCRDVESCSILVSRTWSHLQQGGPIKICVSVPWQDGDLCITNAPVFQTGGGGGIAYGPYEFDCGAEGYVYKVETPCGTKAEAVASCSDCD